MKSICIYPIWYFDGVTKGYNLEIDGDSIHQFPTFDEALRAAFLI